MVSLQFPTKRTENYLVNSQGNYVMDTQGLRIKLPQDASDLAVSPSGELSIGAGAPFAVLNIASFANNEGLEAVEENCFIPTDASGPATAAQGVTVKQGFWKVQMQTWRWK